jgi:hypothetical protein
MKSEFSVPRAVGIFLLVVGVVLAPIVSVAFSLSDSDILKGNWTFEDPSRDFPGAGATLNSDLIVLLLVPFAILLFLGGGCLLGTSFRIILQIRTPVLRC